MKDDRVYLIQIRTFWFLSTNYVNVCIKKNSVWSHLLSLKLFVL
jgi:hypothetical protein